MRFVFLIHPQIRDQPQHQRPRVAQRLAPGKSRRDTVQNPIKLRTPTIKVYPKSRGGRGSF
jgi:hypothetical protein